MMWPFRKKAPPAPKPKPKPARVAVHLKDGRTVVHVCRYRRIDADGSLHLFEREGGAGVVADYVAGSWYSVSCGKRAVING